MNSYVDNIIDLINLHFETKNKKYLDKALDTCKKVIPQSDGIAITELSESLTTAIKALTIKNKNTYLPIIQKYLKKYLKAK